MVCKFVQNHIFFESLNPLPRRPQQRALFVGRSSKGKFPSETKDLKFINKHLQVPCRTQKSSIPGFLTP